MIFLWRRRVLGPPFARGMALSPPVGSSQVREQAPDRPRVRRVDERRAAEPPLLLARLRREQMAQVAAPPLELPFAGHPEALGSAPARLELGHGRSPRHLATSIIDTVRPSRRAGWSTTATSATASAIRSSMALPSSGCVIWRPRKNTVTFTRCPSARNPRMWPTLKSTSCVLVSEPTFTSFSTLAAPFLRPLLHLVAVLAVVHDPADRRRGVRGDLDQVEVALLREALRLLGAHDAELRPVGVDHPHLAGANLAVHPNLVVDLGYGAPPGGRASALSRSTKTSRATASCCAPPRRGATLRAWASRSPTTAITGTFWSCASRIL